MRDLHAATACAIAGFAEAADPELEPLFPEVVVVAEADVLVVEADVLLAGALLAVLEDELLPQPAAAMPTAAATNNNTSGLRIIVLSPCVACAAGVTTPADPSSSGPSPGRDPGTVSPVQRAARETLSPHTRRETMSHHSGQGDEHARRQGQSSGTQ
jgi:hypothetical protein